MLITKSAAANNKGMAVLEMIPILIIIVLLLNFSIGFFGIIQTGLLNTMAARNYIFENLRNRSDVTYHRDSTLKYNEVGSRFGGIISERASEGDNWIATSRKLSWVNFFGGTSMDGQDLSREPAAMDQTNTHVDRVPGLGQGGVRNESVEVYNVWIRSLYGICLDSICGD